MDWYMVVWTDPFAQVAMYPDPYALAVRNLLCDPIKLRLSTYCIYCLASSLLYTRNACTCMVTGSAQARWIVRVACSHSLRIVDRPKVKVLESLLHILST